MLTHVGGEQAGDELLDSRMARIPALRAGYGGRKDASVEEIVEKYSGLPSPKGLLLGVEIMGGAWRLPH